MCECVCRWCDYVSVKVGTTVLARGCSEKWRTSRPPPPVAIECGVWKTETDEPALSRKEADSYSQKNQLSPMHLPIFCHFEQRRVVMCLICSFIVCVTRFFLISFLFNLRIHLFFFVSFNLFLLFLYLVRSLAVAFARIRSHSFHLAFMIQAILLLSAPNILKLFYNLYL